MNLINTSPGCNYLFGQIFTWNDSVIHRNKLSSNKVCLHAGTRGTEPLRIMTPHKTKSEKAVGFTLK